MKSCRNTNPRSLNQSRFIPNRTGCFVPDYQRFNLIQTRCVSFGVKPALIMIRWNFRGVFHFFSCTDLSRLPYVIG